MCGKEMYVCAMKCICVQANVCVCKEMYVWQGNVCMCNEMYVCAMKCMCVQANVCVQGNVCVARKCMCVQ